MNIRQQLEAHQEELIKIYETINSKTKSVKELCLRKGIEYSESIRVIASKLIDEGREFENITTTETTQYEGKAVSTLSALKEDGKIMSIDEYCVYYQIPKEQVKTYKLVTHSSKGAYYNIASRDVSAIEDLIEGVSIEDTLLDIITRISTPEKSLYKVNEKLQKDYFDRLVFTDVHINLDPNGDGNPLYGGIYDKEEILIRMETMVQHTIDNQLSDCLYIDELGDYMDGLNGKTTRASGHTLPQLTNDKDAFDLGVEFKVKMIKRLLPFYKKIVCNNITNDNHSGDFSYFVNTAVKNLVEALYPEQVEYNVINKFFHHYSVNQHTMVLTHGKDTKDMKHGMKPILDANAKNKIDQYCKHHGLYNGKFIEFSKGDSHQAIFDESTSQDFNYFSYPAFSPPSAWVQTNFGLSRSGFRFYNIHREKDQKITHPYYFN